MFYWYIRNVEEFGKYRKSEIRSKKKNRAEKTLLNIYPIEK